jgi:hypothetical protein
VIRKCNFLAHNCRAHYIHLHTLQNFINFYHLLHILYLFFLSLLSQFQFRVSSFEIRDSTRFEIRGDSRFEIRDSRFEIRDSRFELRVSVVVFCCCFLHFRYPLLFSHTSFFITAAVFRACSAIFANTYATNTIHTTY